MILPLLLLLSGCGAAGTGTCAFVKVAELPVVFRQNIPLVDVTMNGTKVNMILDTGASISALTDDQFKALNVGTDQTIRVTVTAVGGSSFKPNALISRLELGGEIRHGMSIVVVDVPTLTKAGIGGLLGRDVLGQYDIDLDMPHSRVGLYKQRTCPGGKPDWTDDFEVLPGPAQGRALQPNMISVQVNGLRRNAELDSGATIISMDHSEALSLGVTQEMLEADRHSTIQGATKAPTPTALHRFDSLSIGSELIKSPVVTVSMADKAVGTEFNHILIGETYLRRHRIWIANGDSYVAVAKPPTSP